MIHIRPTSWAGSSFPVSRGKHILFIINLSGILPSTKDRCFEAHNNCILISLLYLYQRMWTRGYDVYTPTRTLVFHSYQPQPENHGMNEWFQQRRDRIRNRSLLRIQTSMELKDGDASDAGKANMGIYGIGKRRTLAQLNEFVGIDMAQGIGNEKVSFIISGFSSFLYIVGACCMC